MSELELAVLGLLWRDGPLTRYQVRKDFLNSPSSHWSGSAGAIYPLMERLEGWNWVRSQATQNGRRQSREYSITDAGKAALARELHPENLEDICAVLVDPLRTRIQFYEVLPKQDRIRFLHEAESGLQEHLHGLKNKRDQESRNMKPQEHLATRGAILLTESRLQWIKELLESFNKVEELQQPLE